MTHSKSYIARCIQKLFLQTQLTKIGLFNENPFTGMHWENIYIDTQDFIKIGVWILRPPKSKGCLIYLHGNASNRVNSAKNFQLDRLVRGGYTLVIPDYREFGDSCGFFEVTTVNYDIKAVHNYCVSQLNMEPVIIGFSLGGAIALEYCRIAEFKNKVILISTFYSSEDMLNDIFLYRMTSYFMPSIKDELKITFNYESDKNITYLKPEQVLVIHGEKDDLINIKHSKKLVETINCRHWYTKNDSHTSIMIQKLLLLVIDDFLQK